MPIPHDAWGVFADHPPRDGDGERDDQSECLLARIRCRVPADVPGADRICRGDGAPERELELEDVESAQWHSEEYADVGTAEGECDDAPVINWLAMQGHHVRYGEAHPKSDTGSSPRRPSWYAAGKPDVKSNPKDPAACAPIKVNIHADTSCKDE